MKKLFTICLVMLFLLADCSSEPASAPSGDNVPPSNTDTPSTDTNGPDTSADGSGIQENGTIDTDKPEDTQVGTSSNILVAYFSRVGNTVWEEGIDAVTSASLNVVNGEFAGNAQLLAQMAQEATGGDLFLIQCADTYPSDYRETTDVAADEQKDNARPDLASHVENMDSYDTIVLIYPNWWGDLPMPLCSFLEEYDFSGKTILPLCTHEGSRMGSSEKTIASLCPDATLLDGLAVRGRDAAAAQNNVETWINQSGILA